MVLLFDCCWFKLWWENIFFKSSKKHKIHNSIDTRFLTWKAVRLLQLLIWTLSVSANERISSLKIQGFYKGNKSTFDLSPWEAEKRIRKWRKSPTTRLRILIHPRYSIHITQYLHLQCTDSIRQVFTNLLTSLPALNYNDTGNYLLFLKELDYPVQALCYKEIKNNFSRKLGLDFLR